MLEDEDKKKA